MHSNKDPVLCCNLKGELLQDIYCNNHLPQPGRYNKETCFYRNKDRQYGMKHTVLYRIQGNQAEDVFTYISCFDSIGYNLI